MPKIDNQKDAGSQHARFLETARALGCDEDEAAFDEKLKAVVGPSLPKKKGDESRQRPNQSGSTDKP